MKVTVVDKSNLVALKEACEISRGNSFTPEMFKRILRMGHLSILEHAFISFKIEGISRVCSHQFVRKRIASYTQESQRHREISGLALPDTLAKNPKYNDTIKMTVNTFTIAKRSLEDEGENKEDIRYLAPQASSTSIIASYNLHSFWNLLDFRYCTRAQQETRDLAKNMYIKASEVFPDVMVHWCPRCVKAYGRYCPEPCEGENVTREFRKLKEGLFKK